MRKCNAGGSERIHVEPGHVRKHKGAAPYSLLNPPRMPHPSVRALAGVPIVSLALVLASGTRKDR
jgi:hypothetical protein